MSDNFNGFNSLVIFLTNHGLKPEEIVKHRSKLEWINNKAADNFMPADVTRTKRHFILKYRDIAGTRTLEIYFSLLSSSDVKITLGSEPLKQVRATPDTLREAFGWLYEHQERANLAKRVISNIERDHKSCFTLTGYSTKDDEKIGDIVEVEKGKTVEATSLNAIYRHFRSNVAADGRYVLHVDAETRTYPPMEDTIAIDTQVLEKAFYFGDGAQPTKDGIVKRLWQKITGRK